MSPTLDPDASLYTQHAIIIIIIIIIIITSGYTTWFTAGGAIRIADYDVTDDDITRKL